MKRHSRNTLVSLTALALGATVLLTGCSEDAAGSTAEAASTQQSTTTAATAPTQPAITKTATGATAEQTSELLSSLTHQEMEELISGNTTLAEMEKKRLTCPKPLRPLPRRALHLLLPPLQRLFPAPPQLPLLPSRLLRRPLTMLSCKISSTSSTLSRSAPRAD